MSRFSNPLLYMHESADPFLRYYDGLYYLSVTRGLHLSFYRSKTLAGLHEAPEEIIWRDEHPERYIEMWAPEFFHLDGRWWCYYTASNGRGRHRCHVLRGQESDLFGPYEYQAQLLTDVAEEQFAIDFSVIQTPTGRYGVWAGHPNHRLWISRMTSPYELAPERTLLEADGFGCEEVREGPNALVRNGRVFLIYSVCDARKTEYKMGMLVAEENADLTDASSWTQYPHPVFRGDNERMVYGPGHQFFFKSPDGSQDWMSYHVKRTTDFIYDDRVVCAKQIEWHEDGTPDLGTPPTLGEELQEPSGT